jgi:alcohol oxidase
MVMTAFVNVFDGPMVDLDLDGQYLTIGNILLYPYSRGSIHITNASGGYTFRSGFLEEDFDVKALAWGYKHARNIARNLPFFMGEVAATHPQYQNSSTAAKASQQDVCGEDGKYVREDYPYSPEDEAAIETWVRSSVRTTWHSLGTCAMRPREAGGVVDPHLNVFGTEALKVADLSIAPENIGANVGNTAFAVGEKAAVIIAGELGIDL